MPEEQKPVEGVKPDQAKVVPLSDLLAFKKGSLEREKKLRVQLEEAEQKIGSLEGDIKINDVNLDDDNDVKGVRKYLLEEKRKVETERARLEKDLASFTERERKVKAKELADQYGIDVESLASEDDIEGTALRLYADKLAVENKALEEQVKNLPKPEEKPATSESPQIFETGQVGKIRKSPLDMNPTEFDQYEKDLKSASLSKK